MLSSMLLVSEPRLRCPVTPMDNMAGGLKSTVMIALIALEDSEDPAVQAYQVDRQGGRECLIHHSVPGEQGCILKRSASNSGDVPHISEPFEQG